MILELLQLALDWDPDDYENMPDYGDVLAHLGLTGQEPREEIRDAVEEALALLELDQDLDGVDMELDAPDFEPNDARGLGGEK